MTTTTKKTKLAPGAKKRARRAAKRNLVKKLHSDKEFAKTLSAARTKRAADKKLAFRKKKSRKK